MTAMHFDDQEDVTRDTYRTTQDRSLSSAILQAIEEHVGSEKEMHEFVLYNDVDPDALDNLFRPGASANTVVKFDTDDVRVGLWGDGGVEIRVVDQNEEWLA